MKVIAFDNDPDLQGLFMEAARGIYSGDTGWLGDSATGRLGVEDADPLRRHFLAMDGSRILGRVSAAINPALREMHGPAYAQLGQFECVDDVAAARALIQEAIGWLRQAAPASKTLLAPMDLDTWHAYRLRTGGFDEASFPMEPYNPAYYPALFAALGFAPVVRYVTKTVNDPAIPMQAWEASYKRATRRGYRFRSFDGGNRPGEMLQIHGLSREMFCRNPFYVDISLAEFARMYAGEAGQLDTELFVFMLDPQGETVGFAFASPDRRRHELVNIKTFGTLPRVHGLGAGAALAMEVYRRAIRRGFTRINHCLMRAGNEADLMDRGGARVTREYTLYSKAMSE
jgi:GNAT superfamily N-acetyltransferase